MTATPPLDPREHFAGRPKVDVAAGVVLRDGAGRVLLVRPTYKAHWDLPGGGCEAGESPRDCAVREVREELGIDVRIGELSCVDYRRPQPGRRGDALRFVFAAAMVGGGDVTQVTPAADEIAEVRFVEVDALESYLDEPLLGRVRAALVGGGCYLEEGRAPDSSD